MAIDWDGSLEAIEMGEPPVSAEIIGNDGSTVMPWSVKIDGTIYWADDDGEVPGTPWTVRNRE